MPNNPQDYDQEHVKLAKARTKDLKEFFEHLGSYLIVNTTLFIIDWLSGGGWWFHWPLLGWGVGLAFHGLSVFVKSPLDRYVSHVERRELRRVARERKHRLGNAFRENHRAHRQQQEVSRHQPFVDKLKEAIGSDTLKDLGQELSSAMKELETELGEFGLGWTKTSSNSLKGYQYVDQGERRLPGLSQTQKLFEFLPIQAINTPLDSDVNQRLNALERQLKNE